MSCSPSAEEHRHVDGRHLLGDAPRDHRGETHDPEQRALHRAQRVERRFRHVHPTEQERRRGSRAAGQRAAEPLARQLHDRGAQIVGVVADAELVLAQGEALVASAAEPEEPERGVRAVARLLHDRQQRAGGVPDADAERVGPARQHLFDRPRVDVGNDLGRQRVAVVGRVALPHRRRVDRDDDEPTIGEVPHHAVVAELRRWLQVEVPA